MIVAKGYEFGGNTQKKIWENIAVSNLEPKVFGAIKDKFKVNQ